MKNYSIAACALLLCVVVGCGKGYVQMGGTVTFSDDNAPLTVGTVIFEQGAHHARGPIDEQGRYVLGFDKPGSGLPKGTWTVHVVDAMVQDGTVSSTSSSSSSGTYERPTYKNLIDPKFNSAATSGLTFTVDGTEKKFDFSVERAKN